MPPLKNHKGQKFARVLILVLVILVALSASALAGTILYRHFSPADEGPASAPDNIITPEKAAAALSPSRKAAARKPLAPVRHSDVFDRATGETVSLEISRRHAGDSAAFQVSNMFPGDSETASYQLDVSYEGRITVQFCVDIRAGYEKLAEVLNCRVSLEGGSTLYDGRLADMPASIPHELSADSATTDSLLYTITVYLDTSVGNEYMDEALLADFRWWVSEEETDPDQPGGLTPPKTGDDAPIALWLSVAASSLVLSVLLLLPKRRRPEQEEQP